MDQDHGGTTIKGKVLVHGSAQGRLLASTTALSFWGGVDSTTGNVVDQHHPLVAHSVTGTVLAIPSSRGSCSGSGVLLELLLNEKCPVALVFEREETILTLGVIIASEFFGRSIPVVQLSPLDFSTIISATWVEISGGNIRCMPLPGPCSSQHLSVTDDRPSMVSAQIVPPNFTLTSLDHELLNGSHGKAAQAAARVIMKVASIQGATEMIDITQAHIDCCLYTGPATLLFAQKLRSLHAKVRVPSTLNSISIDRHRWRKQGIDSEMSEPAIQLADAYIDMGVKPTYTCAPYLLEEGIPKQGEQIMWAESNAVVYANSVLGARTIKCPDYLDICAALTGRVPNTGCHVMENRRAQIRIRLPYILESMKTADADSLFPLLGYLIGDIAEDQIPIIKGLESIRGISNDDLKAFGAAFATTSSAPMFHIAGITPEASTDEDIARHWSTISSAEVIIDRRQLARIWKTLNPTTATKIDLISLGNPHFSYAEILKLARFCNGRSKHDSVEIMVTCARETFAKAHKQGHVATLEAFGVRLINDTCWCMITEPVIPTEAETIMTNSAKYAHYGAGLTGRQMRFGSLAQCVEAACCGFAPMVLPSWLQDGE